MKKNNLIEMQLNLLFECPIIQDKVLNYSKEDEKIVLNLLNEINKRLLALTVIDAKTLLNEGDL